MFWSDDELLISYLFFTVASDRACEVDVSIYAVDDENKVTDLGKVEFTYYMTFYEEFKQIVLDQEQAGQWATDQGIIEVHIMTYSNLWAVH